MTTYASSAIFKSHLILNTWVDDEGGSHLASVNPLTGSELWRGHAATDSIIQKSIAAAQGAFPVWRNISYDQRKSILLRFTELVHENAAELTKLVSEEAGKPTWEAKVEVNALITKFEATSQAYESRCAEFGRDVKGRFSRTRFNPHGVLVVLGPFNFPLSMANGHIMPALLAGNCVVFKPSEQTPVCGLFMAHLWAKAGLPPGVLNCVSGGAEVAKALVIDPDINGILFVGSHAAGMDILSKTRTSPEKIVALEMGGNSPLLVHDFPKEKTSSIVKLVIQSNLISGGQRCSAARRLIVLRSQIDFLRDLVNGYRLVRCGEPSSIDQPYYGPLISPRSAERCIARYNELVLSGAVPLLEPKVEGPNRTLVSPGILEMSNCLGDADEEIFGPILKVYLVNSLDEGIEFANATRFGLAAGIITSDVNVYHEFYSKVKAGIINWNQPLTGATTFAPFGGVGQSGNYRPAGFLSSDYCSYATASFEVTAEALDDPMLPGVSL
jgi:succinylglutamic semialdehyde dehydrogenase